MPLRGGMCYRHPRVPGSKVPSRAQPRGWRSVNHVSPGQAAAVITGRQCITHTTPQYAEGYTLQCSFDAQSCGLFEGAVFVVVIVPLVRRAARSIGQQRDVNFVYVHFWFVASRKDPNKLLEIQASTFSTILSAFTGQDFGLRRCSGFTRSGFAR